MDEQEFRSLVQQYATQARLEQGEATLTSVLKLIITEYPDLKTQARSSVSIVKDEIAKVNSMADDELEEFSDADLETGDESSEYEMLDNLVLKKIEEDKELSTQVKSLIIYGSYAKKLHVVGESDINFVAVLNSNADSAIEKINVLEKSDPAEEDLAANM